MLEKETNRINIENKKKCEIPRFYYVESKFFLFFFENEKIRLKKVNFVKISKMYDEKVCEKKTAEKEKDKNKSYAEIQKAMLMAQVERFHTHFKHFNLFRIWRIMCSHNWRVKEANRKSQRAANLCRRYRFCCCYSCRIGSSVGWLLKQRLSARNQHVILYETRCGNNALCATLCMYVHCTVCVFIGTKTNTCFKHLEFRFLFPRTQWMSIYMAFVLDCTTHWKKQQRTQQKKKNKTVKKRPIFKLRKLKVSWNLWLFGTGVLSMPFVESGRPPFTN